MATAIKATLLESILAAGVCQAVSPLDMLESLPQFQPEASWVAWHAFLGAAFGLPLSSHEQAVYRASTGRVGSPGHQVREAWVLVGRRGGKDRIGSLIAAYLASYRDYRKILAPGQRGTLPVIAADRKQAREMMGYLRGIFCETELRCLLEGEPSAEAIHLKTRVTIEVHTASYRSVRGYTLVGAVLNEVAFWRSDDGSKNPDREILAAIRPGLATVPGSILVALSSPYAQRGVLWDMYERYYGKESDDVLVWQADTCTMHPSNAYLNAEVARAYSADPASAAAEFGAQFRTDVIAYISAELLDANTVKGVTRIEPREAEDIRAKRVKPVTYLAFVDVSGGAQDAFALAIAHWDPDTQKAVLDLAQAWPAPFSPEEITKEAARIVKEYRIRHVKGDKYAGEWPRERFAANGIGYLVTDDVKHDIYRDVMPAFTSKRVQLLDLHELRAQYLSLDRRVTSAGRDVIEHPVGGHDDLANAVSGALLEAYRIGKHVEAIIPAKDPPKSLLELRQRQHQEAWEKLHEQDETPESPHDMW